MIEFGHGTHRGLRRDINEDTYYADPGSGLFLVADGMGGRDRGDRAAAAARDRVAAGVSRGESLRDAVRDASRCVTHACPRSRGDAAPVGTTLAGLHLSCDGFDMAWVGDSGIYMWHGTGWYGLSRAHENLTPLINLGLVQGPVSEDTNAPATAPAPRRRHILTQALGVTPPAELDVCMLQGRCTAGMRFLICSDGLSEQLTDASMQELVGRDDLGVQECVDQLIRQALDSGGDDNLTAVLVRIS